MKIIWSFYILVLNYYLRFNNITIFICNCETKSYKSIDKVRHMPLIQIVFKSTQNIINCI